MTSPALRSTLVLATVVFVLVEGLLIYKYQLIGNGHVVATYSGEHAKPFLHKKLI